MALFLWSGRAVLIGRQAGRISAGISAMTMIKLSMPDDDCKFIKSLVYQLFPAGG
jgi:hypothetical protein